MVLTSTEMSGNNAQKINTLSSLASLEPQIATIYSDLNEPTMPYGFGWHLATISPNLNDFNLPLNPFNKLKEMALANSSAEGHDGNYSPHSPELPETSPISTRPLKLSAIWGWKTTHYDGLQYILLR